MREYCLDELFDLQMGKTPSRNKTQYWKNGNNDWISIGDLSSFDKYVGQTKEQLTDLAVSESGIKEIPADTVIMSFKLSIGKLAITTEKIYSNEAIMAFIDKKVEQISPDYLYYLLLSKDWNEGTNKAVMGITLNKTTLSKVKIKLHDFKEQEEIILILDKASKLISLRKLQIDDLDNLIKSRFVEIFGDLAVNPFNWKESQLIDLCSHKDDIKCGPFGTQLSKDEYQKEGVPLWGIPQINSFFTIMPTDYLSEEKAKKLEAYSIIKGDIVMSRKGNVGKCAIYPDELPRGIMHSDALRIRINPEEINSKFLMHQLHNSRYVVNQIENVSSGAIMAGVNVTKLKTIFVHIPPIELQNEFETFVQHIDKLKVE